MTWTIIMIIIATIINLLVTWQRNMREFALVGAWALIAIAYANNDSHMTIVYTAGIAATVLIIGSMIHSFANRDTNPLQKCMEYFKN